MEQECVMGERKRQAGKKPDGPAGVFNLVCRSLLSVGGLRAPQNSTLSAEPKPSQVL